MKVGTAATGKRKANDISEILEDHLQQCNGRFEKIDENIEKIEKKLIELTEAIAAIKKLKTSEAEETEEDLSDDDETVVDDADTWKDIYRELRTYRIFHGDCKVPRGYKENQKLGRWVDSTRTLRKKGKLASERIVQLDRIGFHWGKNSPSQPSWEEMFEKLQEWKQKMKNCNVPFNASNPSPLAKWCAYQRAEYKRLMKGRDSLITPDQVEMLRGIGFKWKGPKL